MKTVGNVPQTGNGWRFIKYTSSTKMPSSVQPIRRQRRRTCKQIFGYGNNSSQDQWKHYSILRPRVAITANSADPAGLSSIPNVRLICPFLPSQEAHFLEAGDECGTRMSPTSRNPEVSGCSWRLTTHVTEAVTDVWTHFQVDIHAVGFDWAQNVRREAQSYQTPEQMRVFKNYFRCTVKLKNDFKV